MNSIRRPLKFMSEDGDVTYTFPREQLDYDSSQSIEAPSVQLTGASYDYDLLGTSLGIRRNGIHTLRFLLVGTPTAVEAEIDEMREKLYGIGRGWFYVEDYEGVQRRCTARMSNMPEIHLGVRDRERAPVAITFSQYSDFFDAAPIDEHDGAVQTINADPDTIFINNPGNAPVFNAVITVKGAFSGVTIENVSYPIPGMEDKYRLEVNVTGVDATDWLRFRCGVPSIEISTDSGATWDNVDVDLISHFAGQVSMMPFKAGINELLIGGCDTCEIEFEFAGAWL